MKIEPLMIYEDVAWLPPEAQIEISELPKRKVPEDILRQLSVLALQASNMAPNDDAVLRMAFLLERNQHFVASVSHPNFPNQNVVGMLSMSKTRYGSPIMRMQQLRLDALYLEESLRGTYSLVPEMLVYTALKQHAKNKMPVFVEPHRPEFTAMGLRVITAEMGKKHQKSLVPVADNPDELMKWLEKTHPWARLGGK